MKNLIEEITKKLKHEDLRTLDELVECMAVKQKSYIIQFTSFLVMILIAFFLWLGTGAIYTSVESNQISKTLGKKAMNNAITIADGLEEQDLIDILNNTMTKDRYTLIDNRFQLYKDLLGAEYTYLQINQKNLDWIKLEEEAGKGYGGKKLSESNKDNIYKFVFLSDSPGTLYIDNAWDDISDYTKPGPLEAIKDNKAVYNLYNGEHPRWGALISGEAPVTVNGEVIGFVGVDYSTKYIENKINAIWAHISRIYWIVFAINLILHTMIFAHSNGVVIDRYVHIKYDKEVDKQ